MEAEAERGDTPAIGPLVQTCRQSAVSEQGQTLSDRQRLAIIDFVTAKNFKAGCKKAGVSRQVFYNWLGNPVFRKELDRVREEVISEALKRLKAGFTHAVDVLLDLVDDKEKWIRIRAAERISDLYFKSRECEELEGRLTSIERVIFEKRTYSRRDDGDGDDAEE